MLNKQFYFLAPVEVVRVTRNNLEEVAEWCGGRVATVDSKNVPGRVDSYVWVPTPKGTSISWAFPGMFVTKRLVVSLKDELKATFAVFRRDYFEKNYFDLPIDAVNATWEREAKKQKKSPELSEQIPNVVKTTNVPSPGKMAEYHKKVQELRSEKKAFSEIEGLERGDTVTFVVDPSKEEIAEMEEQDSQARRIEAGEDPVEVLSDTGIQYPAPGDLSHINEMVRQSVEAEEIHLKRECDCPAHQYAGRECTCFCTHTE